MKSFSDRDIEDYVLDRMDDQNKSELEAQAREDAALSQRLREVRDVLDPLRRMGENVLHEDLPPALRDWLNKQKL